MQHERQVVTGDWQPRFGAYIPAAALVLVMSAAWLTSSPTFGIERWGVSARALFEGRLETLGLHILTHGSVFHLLMNAAALLELGGLVVARLGGFPRGWIRFLIAFVLTALSGAITFLSFHPDGRTPLIGASGGIYGLLGLLLFIRLSEETDMSPQGPLRGAVAFLSNNKAFLAILVVGALLSGLSDRISWEAHAGGFVFGAALGPWLSPPLVGGSDGRRSPS